MATLSFSISVPDADVQRVVKALRYAYGTPNATIAELVEMLRCDARDKVKGIVRTYEENQALKAVGTAVTTLNAT